MYRAGDFGIYIIIADPAKRSVYMSVFRKLLSLCVAVLCVMSFTACSQSGSSASSFPTDYGFSVQLPESVQENIRYDLSNREVGDETINTINVVYEGETGEANILTFEEMSSAMWEQMQSEGGPLPTELGASEDGRVVVMYPLQSNPYEAGTADADAVDLFVSESSIVTESFQFLQ